MLALKPVLLNGDTGVITLPYEDFVIEPKVVYSMQTCELGHNVPFIKHNCGIVTCLDFHEMENYIQALPAYDMTRIPVLAVLQVLGNTVLDSERRGFRSRSIFYYGFIPNAGVPLLTEKKFLGYERWNSCYYNHISEYDSAHFSDLRDFYHYLARHGFDYATMTGVFRGYTGE